MRYLIPTLLLSGCASGGYAPMPYYPQTHYVLPPPPVLTVPQQHQIVCTPNTYNNQLVCR